MTTEKNDAVSINTSNAGQKAHHSIGGKKAKTAARTLTYWVNSNSLNPQADPDLVALPDALKALNAVEKKESEKFFHENWSSLPDRAKAVYGERPEVEEDYNAKDEVTFQTVTELEECESAADEKYLTRDTFNVAVTLTQARTAKNLYNRYFMSIKDGVVLRSKSQAAFERAVTEGKVGCRTKSNVEMARLRAEVEA